MTGPRLFQIGEVARRTGLTQRTLRHYDQLALLSPSERSHADYRLYTPADLKRLLAIVNLKSLGLSLDEIAKALADPTADAASLLSQHSAEVERRIAAEQELLRRLRRLQVDDQSWEEVLEAIALSERLRHPDAPVRFQAMLTDAPKASLDELIDLLSDPVVGVREGATWALAQRPGVREELVSRLAKGNELARQGLAHILGKLGDPAGGEVLLGLLRDPAGDVAAKAAFSLGQLGDPAAVPALIAALSDEREEVRSEAVAAIARFPQCPEAVALLAGTLHGSRNAAAREHAAEALGLLGAVDSAADLRRALGDEAVPVRLAALFALGALDSPTATVGIESALRDEDARVRALARRLLA